MIIVKTPFRISFFGGGTDLPVFSRRHAGAVLGVSIDKYIYHSVSKFPSELFDYSIRFSYSKVEYAKNIDLIKHRPFKEILKQFKITKDIELNIAANLPSFSGLGSSSAFTVGLINAISVMQNLKYSKHKLATEAIRIEQDILKEDVGSQDQIFASYGGMRLINFHKNGEFKVNKVNIKKSKKEELQNSLLIFFTGVTRNAQSIESKKIKNIDNINENLLNMLKMVDKGLDILEGNASLTKFGILLDKTWKEKRLLDQSVSTPFIDEIYTKAINAGALGGKLLGAGGGGFLLLFVPEDKKKNVRKYLANLHEVSFDFEDDGSHIIHK